MSLPEEKLRRLEYLKQLLEEHRAYEEGGGVIRKPWREVARPNQLAPEGDWFIWLLLAGRGFGKTRAAAEWCLEKARKYPRSRIALVGQTIADVRDTMIEGDSGLLSCLSNHEMRGGQIDTGWNRSLVEVRMANGTYFKGYCVAPETRLLTADLRYIPAGEIEPGTKLAGFEKERAPYRRHYRTAIAESAEIIKQPCYRLILDDDTRIICSDEHQWLTQYSGKTQAKWLMTKNLRVHTGRYSNSRILRLFDLWKPNTSYAAGYLAAAFDGESHRSQEVVAKEFIGEQWVSAIRTSTGTFIAEGLASHNSSEKPWKLRGPQFHFAWGDESCFWADAGKGTITDTTWSNLTIATRLPSRPGWDDDFQTQIVVATTPRTVALLRSTDPDPARRGIMQREDVIITRGKTMENIANLSETYKATVIAPLMGTRLGRQELEAEILDDREDALWRREWIEETRYPEDIKIDFSRVVVAVDPAVSDGESAAETGIVVAAADRNGHGYVLADETMRGSPDVVMRKVASLFHEYKADRVVAEVNNGGDYIGSVLRAVDANIPYRMVRATRGKAVRAEPISALYEQKRVHHIGVFPFLEDQLCSWSPLDAVSPDRLDACFVKGTQVITAQGEYPIEDIKLGQKVWTRKGWRPVTGIRCTQREAAVIQVQLSNGRVLVGTPDHKVWTTNGWLRLDALLCGDTLSGWKIIQSKSGSTVRYTSEIQNQSKEHIEFTIINRGVRSGEMETPCIEQSGKRLKADLFPRDIISTTHSIMSQIIWSLSRPPNTENFMPWVNDISNYSTGRKRVPQPLPNGTGLMKDEPGTENMENIRGKGASPSIQVSADHVEKNSSVFPQTHSIAHGAAITERESENIWNQWNAPSAGNHSNVINTVSDPQPVLVYVVRSSVDAGIDDVYDLQVEDAHEFVANGVIVHNCVWAFTDLKDLVTASWTDAYGVQKCNSCQKPFFKKVDGTPRTNCPFCSAPIED